MRVRGKGKLMIFAELDYDEDYADIHDEVVTYVRSQFSDVQSGLQGDSWVWIFDGEEKVAIDTFSSMKHQIKCERQRSPLLEKVIESLSREFTVRRLASAELEPHEEE